MRIVIVGAGGQSSKIVDALTHRDDVEVIGFVDDGAAAGALRHGRPVLGPTSVLPQLCTTHGIDAGIVSVGDNAVRGRLVDQVEAALPGFAWCTAVHPTAWLAPGSHLGPGAVLLAGAVVQPGCEIGDHAVLDTRASLDHDSTLGRCASLAPGVATGGGCHIGAFTAIGVGAAIVHGRRIGQHTVVGAGSVVIRDLPDHVIAYGVPATVARTRRSGETYL